MRPPSLVLNDHVIGVPSDRELARNVERISCRSQPVRISFTEHVHVCPAVRILELIRIGRSVAIAIE